MYYFVFGALSTSYEVCTVIKNAVIISMQIGNYNYSNGKQKGMVLTCNGNKNVLAVKM